MMCWTGQEAFQLCRYGKNKVNKKELLFGHDLVLQV